jgi:hypothetical protein
MSDLGQRILVARQLASLRQHGWSTFDALGFVSASIPVGGLRSACDEALQRLRTGVTEAPPSSTDSLGALIGRGDAASAPTFECLAEAWEAKDAAQGVLASTTQLISVLVAGPLLIGTVVGWLLPAEGWIPSSSLPTVTAGVLSLGQLLKFIGLPLAIGSVFVVRRLLRKLSPGAREFDAAAALLQFASAAESGINEPTAYSARHLLPLERRYFEWRRSMAGATSAARELANELLRSGRSKAQYFNQIAPVAGAFIAYVLFSGFLTTLWLPIFSIAKNIK